MSAAGVNLSGASLNFRRLLVVIKQTAYEEYSQLKLRGQAPKALRWKRLESRYKAHKACVNELLGILREHRVDFSCVNRVELDRQHLANVDLMVAVGGDGTVLSAAHFLDHGTIPLLGINSDPITEEDKTTVKKKTDERRSHGALCMCTANNMHEAVPRILHGGGTLKERKRIQCVVKSTFSETRLVPALNDLLIANPSPAAVSRFRMGWLKEVNLDDDAAPLRDGGGTGLHPRTSSSNPTGAPGARSFSSNGNGTGASGVGAGFARAPTSQYGTVTRFGGQTYDVKNSLNVWSSGMWVSTSTGSTAAMAAAGGMPMDMESKCLQYLIREHMIEKASSNASSGSQEDVKGLNNGLLGENEQLHLRWNSQKGRIFIDGSHLTHNLVLGDEVLINSKAPPLQLFEQEFD